MNIFKTVALLSTLTVLSCSHSKQEIPKQPSLPPGVTQTYSGLKSKILRPGQGGPTPNSLSTVTAHYTGMTTDGKIFDSSTPRGKPSKFPLDEVIDGWTEGLQLMTRGEKRRFWIPAKLAYGEHPRPGQPSGELIFDIELIDFHQN